MNKNFVNIQCMSCMCNHILNIINDPPSNYVQLSFIHYHTLLCPKVSYIPCKYILMPYLYYMFYMNYLSYMHSYVLRVCLLYYTVYSLCSIYTFPISTTSPKCPTCPCLRVCLIILHFVPLSYIFYTYMFTTSNTTGLRCPLCHMCTTLLLYPNSFFYVLRVLHIIIVSYIFYTSYMFAFIIRSMRTLKISFLLFIFC